MLTILFPGYHDEASCAASLSAAINVSESNFPQNREPISYHFLNRLRNKGGVSCAD